MTRDSGSKSVGDRSALTGGMVFDDAIGYWVPAAPKELADKGEQLHTDDSTQNTEAAQPDGST
ncbi:MAG: hypothetical protein ACUVTZ_00620 [Armatimonadota bacterium]